MAGLAVSIGRDGRRPISKSTAQRNSLHRAFQPSWVISLGLLYWLLPRNAAAHAQQALTSAFSLDAVIRAQSTTNPVIVLPPDQPHLGPVQLTLGAYSRISLDDNINLASTNLESDAIVAEGVEPGRFLAGNRKIGDPIELADWGIIFIWSTGP